MKVKSSRGVPISEVWPEILASASSRLVRLVVEGGAGKAALWLCRAGKKLAVCCSRDALPRCPAAMTPPSISCYTHATRVPQLT